MDLIIKFSDDEAGATAVEYALMLGTGASAVFFVQKSSDRMALVGLLGWVVIYALLAVGVHRLEKGKMASSSWQRSPR